MVLIRGIERVVSPTEMVAGRFYLESSYDREPTLFQFIAPSGARYDNAGTKGLIFSIHGKSQLAFQELDLVEPIVEMPEVHIRIDPPSLVGSHVSHSMRANMLLVVGNEAIILAPAYNRGWIAVNISTGQALDGRLTNWLTFSRWSLVVDEGGEEITIASFGSESDN